MMYINIFSSYFYKHSLKTTKSTKSILYAFPLTVKTLIRKKNKHFVRNGNPVCINFVVFKKFM